MAFSTLQAGLLARQGLEKRVKLYSEKETKLYSDIVGNVITDNQRYMEIAQIGDFSMAASVNEGSGVPYDNWRSPFSKQYTPVMRAIGFQVTEQAAYTDLYGEVAKPAAKISLAMNKTREQVAANLINNMTSTATNFTGPDGKALAAIDHPLEAGTGSNRPSTDIALSISALEQALQELMLQKSHQGDPHPQMGPFILYVPPQLAMLAKRLVASHGQPGTADNDKNVASGSIVKVHVNPYLTSATAWALRSADNREHGLFMLRRVPLTTKMEYDIDRLVYKYVTFEEYVCGNYNWRGFWGTVGA